MFSVRSPWKNSDKRVPREKFSENGFNLKSKDHFRIKWRNLRKISEQKSLKNLGRNALRIAGGTTERAPKFKL